MKLFIHIQSGTVFWKWGAVLMASPIHAGGLIHLHYLKEEGAEVIETGDPEEDAGADLAREALK